MKQPERIRWLALPALAACVLMFAACSPGPDAPAPSTADIDAYLVTHAQAKAILAAGPEPTLQQLRPLDYWLHYKLMQASGIEAALGGETQALAALQAVGDAYERKLRGSEVGQPRMQPVAFTGEGMITGLVGLGTTAFVGFMAATPAIGSAENIDGLVEKPLDKNGVKASVNDEGQLEVSVEMEINEHGISGKNRLKIRADLCPDAEGKVRLTMDTDSSMRLPAKPGTGGYLRAHFVEEAYYNDDARLIESDPRDLQHADIQMGGFENFDGRHLDEVFTLRGGKLESDEVRDASGFSIFRPEERKLANNLMANAFGFSMHGLSRAILNTGADGRGWIESGRCVVLKPTSTPAKRSGAKPSTQFQVVAEPRAQSDGAPTGGSVRATLSGGDRLDQNGAKVPADARYGYAAPKEEDASASIAFEARSKRGVGRATLEFNTKKTRAYLAEGGLDDFHGTGRICDLAQPFTISGGGNTMTFTPSSEKAGSYSYQGNMGGIGVYGNGTYTASVDENGGTLTGTGNGCVKTPMGTRCANDTERYTLTRTEPCEATGP